MGDEGARKRALALAPAARSFSFFSGSMGMVEYGVYSTCLRNIGHMGSFFRGNGRMVFSGASCAIFKLETYTYITDTDPLNHMMCDESNHLFVCFLGKHDKRYGRFNYNT